jgi:hypothetical protein
MLTCNENTSDRRGVQIDIKDLNYIKHKGEATLLEYFTIIITNIINNS